MLQNGRLATQQLSSRKPTFYPSKVSNVNFKGKELLGYNIQSTTNGSWGTQAGLVYITLKVL